MFELVHTVTKYYDGPRQGIADHLGVPHFYESRWSDIDTDQEDTFLLMPIPAEIVKLALEDWAIWRRWEVAFHKGQIAADTHPALPEDRERHSELQERLKHSLFIDESKAFCARARFQVQIKEEHEVGMKPLEVEWTLVSSSDYVDNRSLIDF